MNTPPDDDTRDDDALRARMRVILIASAAVASAGLAALADELLIGGAIGEARMSFRTLAYGSWAALLGGIGGGLVMRAALARSSPWHVLWIAALAGVLHAPLLVFEMVIDAENPLFAGLGILLLGAPVGAPLGLVFGFVFLAGLTKVHGELAAPTDASLEHAWLAAAHTFAAASAVALLLAIPLGGSYCQLVFFVIAPALGVEVAEGTNLEWTRFLVLPAPFVLLAVSAWRLARWSRVGAEPPA